MTQGATFAKWQDDKFLAQACERLKDFSSMKIKSCFSSTFKQYGNWPGHAKLKCPRYVSEKANWASMHIQGKPCFGGHLEKNVFNIVFLDEDHNLWPTHKKNT